MRFLFLLPLLFLLAGCGTQKPLTQQPGSLTDARRGFKSALAPGSGSREPAETAPPGVFKTIVYPSPKGALAAYISPRPADGKRRPAIIWITGGDCNSIGDVWTPASPDNDQTAAAFREQGVVMMFPSLRGGNANPGPKEGFLGEVDDVLAAAKYLAQQDYVDPRRIYLGGHSTGGTLALLVAESSPGFRAVFSFGPIDDVANYGPGSEFLPFDTSVKREVELRSPGYWLSSVRSPVFVIEGDGGNIEALRNMQKASKNPNLHFVGVRGADHFSVLAPVNKLLARKVTLDTGATCNITLSEEEARGAAR